MHAPLVNALLPSKNLAGTLAPNINGECKVRKNTLRPNKAIERTSSRWLRHPEAAAHVRR
jgi:hypothetical protein